MLSLKQRRLQKLDACASRWALAVETAASVILERPVRIWDRPPALYQILTIRTWVIRYRVSLSWVLRLLLKDRFGRIVAPSKSGGLGLPLRTLCSTATQQYVENEVLRQFPHDENISVWNQKQRSTMLATLRFVKPQKDLNQFVQAYTKWASQEQENTERFAEKLRRRPWRGNPWR